MGRNLDAVNLGTAGGNAMRPKEHGAGWQRMLEREPGRLALRIANAHPTCRTRVVRIWAAALEIATTVDVDVGKSVPRETKAWHISSDSQAGNKTYALYSLSSSQGL